MFAKTTHKDHVPKASNSKGGGKGKGSIKKGGNRDGTCSQKSIDGVCFPPTMTCHHSKCDDYEVVFVEFALMTAILF